MSSAYHRNPQNSIPNNNMTYRGNFGSREQRIEEGNRNLMEEENDRKWVCQSYLLRRLIARIAKRYF